MKLVYVTNRSKVQVSCNRTRLLIFLSLFSLTSVFYHVYSSSLQTGASASLYYHPFWNDTDTLWNLSDQQITSKLAFSPDRVYHHHGMAYDLYSKDEFLQMRPGSQWAIWPLDNESTTVGSQFSHRPMITSPFVVSEIPFVDRIYVLTDPSLNDRHNSLRKVFNRQGISTNSIDWRFKWDTKTCRSYQSRAIFYEKLNLKDRPLTNEQQRKCSLAMKHVEVWYEMAEKNVSLGFILEDDAIFVPFFKEKFARMINNGIRSGSLRLNGACAAAAVQDKVAMDERINQDPMFVIGSCFSLHGDSFEKHLPNARPVLSSHKLSSSRCTHAYLLTSCSARALVQQIKAKQNDFWASDFLQNYLFRLSPTLQSFWIDPPLAYQGNQIIDLDNIATFKVQTYKQV